MNTYRAMTKIAFMEATPSLGERLKNYVAPLRETGGNLKELFKTQVGQDIGLVGLAAAGLGLHHYLKSRRMRQAEEEQRLGQEPQLATDMYPKVGAMVPPPTNAAVASAPPKPGDVKVPAPSVGGVPSLQGAERRAPAQAMGGPGSASGAATGASKGQAKTAMDPTIMALLAGGIGGTGGYLLGKHLISPFAANQAGKLEEKIRDAEKNIGRWKNVESYAPIGAAAAGAILLAALAASKARKDEREKMQQMQFARYQAYDPTGAGFNREDRRSPFGGQFYG